MEAKEIEEIFSVTLDATDNSIDADDQEKEMDASNQLLEYRDFHVNAGFN